MKSIYSYLFTAFYNWLRDSGANPRIMVDATKPGVVVPREYVSNDMILISIYYLYVSDFEILPDKITFYTKFKGKKEYVAIPYNAMTELVSFPSIPVKVTLDEWIEISKYYSTPGSSTFINGVLDKIVASLTEEGRIKKSGRGLI